MDAIDLFAGADGFSTGATMAGRNVVWAENHWPAAAAAHAIPRCRMAVACMRALSTAQSLRLTPRALSFFAYESLRLAAFSAISTAV